MDILVSEAYGLAARVGAAFDVFFSRPLYIVVAALAVGVYFVVFRKHRMEAFVALLLIGGVGVAALYAVAVIAAYLGIR